MDEKDNKNIPDLLSLTICAFQDLNKIHKEIFKPLVDKIIEETKLAIEPLLEPIIILQQFYKEHTKEISECLLELANHCHKISKYLDEDLWVKLKEYGWLIPGTLPIDIAGSLFREIENNKLKEINEQVLFDNFFVEKFSANKWKYLDSLVEAWGKKAKIKEKRLLIIKDCLKVIKRYGKKTSANIVIPALIAQLEGLVEDLFNGKKNLPKETNDKYNATAINLLLETLFMYSNYKDISTLKDPSFSRNKILHGEYTNYGKPENVIKLFLLIEVLVNIDCDNQKSDDL